jgi:hypothetical protein
MVRKFPRALIVLALALVTNACSEPQIYGSIGISSYSGYGYGGGPRMGGSISMGGRIYP